MISTQNAKLKTNVDKTNTIEVVKPKNNQLVWALLSLS
jgi:hypothetical protein